jgi:hypothetical protein
MNTINNHQTYSKQQGVILIPIKDKRKRRMYSYLERYVGKEGIIVDFDSIGYDHLPKLNVYTIKFEDGNLIQVPEEMLALNKRL